MVGFVALIIIVIYIVIALVSVAKIKTKQGKIVVSLIFILIPTVDVIVGRIYFAYLCNAEAGQHIYKTVELENDYFLKEGEIDKSRFGDHPSGYAIAEGGEINRIKLNKLYDFKHDDYEIYSKKFHIFKRERIIKNKKSNEILSRSVSFRYRGGWVENIYNMSPGVLCPSTRPSIHAQLIQETFIRRN